MKKNILVLFVMIITNTLNAHADSSLELRAEVQKEAASLILQATAIYARASHASEKSLQAAYAEVIPNWKCPSAYNEDLQQEIPLMHSCYVAVTAGTIEGGKTNPHTITGPDGTSYVFTDAQFAKLGSDIQKALAASELATAQAQQDYTNIGVGIAAFSKDLQLRYPDVKMNGMMLTMNLKRLVTILGATSNFDFKSSFADERFWNAEKDAAAFMNKYFPVTATENLNN